MADAERAARTAAATWGLPAPVLLRSGMNELFAAGDVVLRVGRVPPTLELAEVLTASGVRVPHPVREQPLTHGDLVVTAWERLVPIDAEPAWEEVGRMVAVVHGLAADRLPVDLPEGERFAWWRFDELLPAAADVVDHEAMAGLRAAVDRHRGWSDGVERVVCHGDVHPGNVVMTGDGAVLLDWDTMCLAPPGWDHAMLLRLPRWGWPARWYERFAEGYGRSFVGEPVAEALADLRLVAATLLRVEAARHDPAQRDEAERRLRSWRADPEAPAWTAV